MHTLVEESTTDFPRSNHLPDGQMPGIEAAVKADGDELPSQSLFRLDDLPGYGRRSRQRFFTEHRLVVPQALMHKLGMGGIG
jgi:hypothetical protein